MRMLILVIQLIVLLTTKSIAQQPESLWCGEVSKLLIKGKLTASVELLNNVLLPGEVLEPIITFSNSSTETLRVPDLRREDILLDALQRVYDPVEKTVGFHSTVDRLPAAETDRATCRINTRLLNPGSKLSVTIPAFIGVPDKSVKIPWRLAKAGQQDGIHKFVVIFGDVELPSSYQVVEAALKSYVCLPVISVPTAETPSNSCNMLLVWASKRGDYLTIKVAPTSYPAAFGLELDSAIGQNGAWKYASSHHRIRLAESGQRIEFGSGDHFPKATDSDQILVFVGGQRLRLKDSLEKINRSQASLVQAAILPI